MNMDYNYKNLVVTLRNKLIMTQEEFTSMLLDVIELNQDYILRRLRIIKADINKWTTTKWTTTSRSPAGNFLQRKFHRGHDSLQLDQRGW